MLYRDYKASVTAPAIKWYPNLKVEGMLHVEVRCPFCDDTHAHGVTREDALLGARTHRHAHCSTLDDAHRYRGKRRSQLEAGKARRDATGGGYFIDLAELGLVARK